MRKHIPENNIRIKHLREYIPEIKYKHNMFIIDSGMFNKPSGILLKHFPENM